MDVSLTGRTALITGGSKGLGLAMAKAFYREHARVAIVARDAQGLDNACREIKAQSDLPKNCKGEVVSFPCDVSDAEAIARMHEQVTARLGPVDVLVNNAGQSAAKPFAEITDAEWQADLDLKLLACIRLSRLTWSGMAERGWGRIINLLNVFAKEPQAGTAPTSISRAAGLALTKVLSAEGAPHNILVNALLIGFVESDQIVRRHAASNSGLALEAFVERAGAGLPMGRMGKPEECADLALFLASERASYLTGCAINVDGGLSKVI